MHAPILQRKIIEDAQDSVGVGTQGVHPLGPGTRGLGELMLLPHPRKQWSQMW